MVCLPEIVIIFHFSLYIIIFSSFTVAFTVTNRRTGTIVGNGDVQYIAVNKRGDFAASGTRMQLSRSQTASGHNVKIYLVF